MNDRELPEPDPAPENGGSLPDRGFGPDPEWDAYVAGASGRSRRAAASSRPHRGKTLEGPAVSLSLGDAADIDPAMLAAICGPDGLGGGDGLGPQFSQDAPADVLRPSPVLAALTEQASADLSLLTDNQLMSALHAARRMENRAQYLQTRAVAEFGRRRGEFEAARARGLRVDCRAGDAAGDDRAPASARQRGVVTL